MSNRTRVKGGVRKADGAAKPDLSGFRFPERWRWVEADPEALEPAEGEEPLRIEIKVSLSGLEVRQLDPREMGFEKLYALIAPMVRDWNLMGDVVEWDGETETRHRRPVPPPAVAGPEVFEIIDHMQTLWIWERLRNARFERPDPEGKPPPPAAPTASGTAGEPDGEDAEDPID